MPPTTEAFGRAEPRLFTSPLRDLDGPAGDLGRKCLAFCRDVLRFEPDPWQQFFILHALEVDEAGRFRFRTILLLVARQNGKSKVVQAILLWALFTGRINLAVGTAQSLGIAKRQWEEACAWAKSTRELRALMPREPRMQNGAEGLFTKHRNEYTIVASTPDAARGVPGCDFLILDELRTHHDFLAYGALTKTQMARPNALCFLMSNAGDDLSVVLNRTREVALAGTDPRLGIFEYSAPDGCALDDLDGILQANPSVGHGRHTLEAIASSRTLDPPGVYRTEVLCQRVMSLDGAVDGPSWAAAADPARSILDLDAPLAACVDASPDGRHVSLVAACVVPGSGGAVRVETVAAWDSLDAAAPEIAQIVGKRVDEGLITERARFAALAWFPAGPAAAIGYELRAAAKATEGLPGRYAEIVDLSGLAVTELCQSFAQLVTSGRLTHSDDPLLNTHITAAKRMMVGDAWRFQRRDGGHVDAAYAAAGAVHVARMLDPGDEMGAAFL